MVKILTTGCSFTHMPHSWARHLKALNYDVTNVAQGGSGNGFNFRNAGLEIMQNNYDIAIFQLTGVNRFETILHSDHFRTLKNMTKSSKHQHLSFKDTYCWIKSTGDYDWWSDGIWSNSYKPKPDQTLAVFAANEKKVKNFCGKFIKNYRMYTNNDPTRLIETLTSIVSIQNMCKVRNVKPLFFSWMKELHLDRYQIKMKENPSEIRAWYDQIDWSTWWFHNSDEGLSEWGIDNGYAGDLEEDHMNNPPQGWTMIDGKKTMIGHPSKECHRAFSEKVIIPWIEKNA